MAVRWDERQFFGDSRDDDVYGNALDQDFHGGGGDDTLAGRQGDDTIYGDEGINSLSGDKGDDYLYNIAGGAMDGGQGSDILAFRARPTNDSFDLIDGGEGLDTVRYEQPYLGGPIDDRSVFIRHAADSFDILVGGASVATVRNVERLHVDIDRGDATIFGGDGDDSIDAGSGDERIDGGGGNDTINVETGVFRVFGGDGEDTLSFQVGGLDPVRLRLSEDFRFNGNRAVGVEHFNVEAGGRADTVVGGLGDDTINGLSGDDRLDGGAGDDLLRDAFFPFSSAEIPTGSNDLLIGGAGNDTLQSNSGADSLRGLDGDDILDVAVDRGVDTLSGGVGDDTLRVETLRTVRDEVVNSELVDGKVVITHGGDVLIEHRGVENFAISGGTADDALTTGDGDDTLNGAGGEDTLDGGAGRDTLRLSGETSGAEVTLLGADWSTVMVDGEATDTFRNMEDVVGTTHDDTIIGDEADNRLEGAFGDDLLTGGAGRDVFVLSTFNESVDVITDFGAAEDMIAINFDIGLERGVLSEEAFRVGSEALDVSDRIILTESGALLYDPDGFRGQKAVEIGYLGPGADLTADNIIIG